MTQRTRAWAAAAMLCATTTATVATASAANYSAILTGPKEAPANTSAGVGAAVVQFNAATHVLVINAAFGALTGETTAAHIHCCTDMPGLGSAGVATETPTFDGFPLGVHNGAYSHTVDTSLTASWSSAFLSASGGTTAGAEAAFLTGLNAGSAYFNIHTTAYPGGEIRGFLTPATAVPEPGSFAMLGLGLPAVLMLARRRRSKA